MALFHSCRLHVNLVVFKDLIKHILALSAVDISLGLMTMYKLLKIQLLLLQVIYNLENELAV